MELSIDRAAVIGSGVMGSALAAHLANAGIPTVLLDIVPPDGSGIEGDPTTDDYRSAFAKQGIQRVLKARPAAFFVGQKARLITPGNLEDHLNLLEDVDWVLEAIIERMDIKKSLFGRIAPYLKPNAMLTSNTSGLSINEMAAELPEDLRPRFLGTHFFNPPRYMKLLEIIPHASTDPDVLEFMTAFGANLMGKGIVRAKDTPNFIANRIGVFSMMAAIRAMLDGGYTIEEVDALTGPAIGRPKSASFRTADIVGLDTFVHVAKNVYDRAVDDECRDYFKPPELLERMVKENLLGEKSKAGFYKKVKKNEKSEILTLDYDAFDYRDRKKPNLPVLELTRSIDDVGERIRSILKGKDRAAEYVWRILSESMVYAANRLGEIADDVVNIDNAMKWGFNWELGPFELWDAIGVESASEKLEQEGRAVPEIVGKLLSAESKSFYRRDDEYKRYAFNMKGMHEELPEEPTVVDLETLKLRGAVVKKNAGASLIDIGDGILCLEFHSKMNAIGGDTIQMMNTAVKEVEKNFSALVIGNQGSNFSVGANLMLILLEAQDGNWEEIDLVVRAFQKANQALKYCKRPVVAAPFGMTLGGGCEVCLGAGHVSAAAETYMGLVEVGVGLIPAGSGCKELLLRNLEGMPNVEGVDVFPYVRGAFETIGMGKVATSGDEARTFKFLRRSDGVTLNGDHLLYSAKAMAHGLAERGYRPPDPAMDIPVAGETGLAAIKLHLFNLREGKFISEYDEYLGGELARILCGGDVAYGTKVPEQYLLDLEREVFLRLCGQRKTQERMKYMLEKGKPLRN
ncbi:MAG: 3-hydroxyacyl-CoA dehydrogenase [Candidatus Latescibacteria bacterium]|nr:3-hydroxyacyl-CoA dehydrogenase [Candidatus Latescibacterota bacterium]NIM21788.1 3-hydroxyacyl-CoA dehydrogenase [Candidatus Latescibacterota bacterium]NIM65926.1 3-hydroxyacyl-CoA dehydrogenase [Candidatus Latescibacterota bacterium]NIO02671.1 3-hydroxyacyl-CoA dehydrogenase [Candidatus Latescibacterota bacterium]NIO29652.1 3-hydroxyacyl-CoA dehydrogenase [Candidatus Latescibacterota bacterium]